MNVREYLQRSPVVVEPDETIEGATRTMAREGVGTIVGLISVDEMTIVLANELGQIVKGVTAQLIFPHAADPAPVPAKVG